MRMAYSARPHEHEDLGNFQLGNFHLTEHNKFMYHVWHNESCATHLQPYGTYHQSRASSPKPRSSLTAQVTRTAHPRTEVRPKSYRSDPLLEVIRYFSRIARAALWGPPRGEWMLLVRSGTDEPAEQQELPHVQVMTLEEVRVRQIPDLRSCTRVCGGGGRCSGQRTSFERCLSCGW
jgi:hypothetical protein